MPERGANKSEHKVLARLEISALTGRDAAHVMQDSELDCCLHPLALEALGALRRAARRDGFELAVASSFRSFEQQRSIWNGKFRGERALYSRSGELLVATELDEAQRVEAILAWSTPPGASRHHWGSDFDYYDRASLPEGARLQLVPAEYAPGGWFAELDAWLNLHAAHYGFFRPYDIDRGGVQPEPWHLSFAPLAVPALRDLSVDVLAASWTGAMIDGLATLSMRLPEMHQRFVLAVAAAPAEALGAGV